MSESGPALSGSDTGPPSALARSLRRIVEAPWPRSEAESAPGMITVLAAAFDAGAQPEITAAAHDIALRFGGGDTAMAPSAEHADTVISAAFHSVCDATRAALEIASMVALAAHGDGNPLARLRIVLCTAADDDGSLPGTRAVGNARGLLAEAAGGQILATAPTAVVAGPTLPAGIDLLDRGLWTPLPDGPPERIYEMRVGGAHADRAGASNLEWARRALHDPAAARPADVAEPLRVALSAWPSVAAGSARMVLLCGGEAADRTAVLAELALRLHADGALVLYGRWTPDDFGTYRAFREALGFHAAACGTDQLVTDLQGWADEIAHLLPEVGARVGGALPGRSGSTFERAGMFDAVGTWMRAITARTPTVLVLDDAERAESTSVSLLSHVWHSCRAHPLMVVVAADRPGVADRLADVAAHPNPSALVRVEVGD
ncbi:AAA ATPase domain-containing protein [Actinokineospora alba]|uniref:AAA ATPase domain-containing protein n=1 Tax=Actinokineospora alba TaxID=504798 RepID=A0A1H0M7V4_9PSEU|nr:ATP-binding protein [Actinokineospora alba]TDP67614.1 AAA ATPase-like protein [Actinokineospora alba]SDI44451.1 AAA ATPase domain-containing protein [Actinokineospora alba]SDO76306.1 AAA ATPase domain-containing protein [Actinokineospora alba]